MAEITIENLGRTIPALPGRSLLTSLLYEELPIHTVCGGRARCGCCRIRILAGAHGLSPANSREKERLGQEERAAGWRLACQTHTLRDITIHLPSADELAPHCRRR